MASKFPTNGDVQLKSRKGHDLTWSCDKHGEPIKFFCKEHVIPLCHPCATKDHGQRPCHLEDIEDVILEKGRKLDDELLRIEKTKPNLAMQDSEIRYCLNFLSDHFRSISEKVSTACDDQIKNVIPEKGEDEIRLINAEADDEIRIINEKRDKRIKASLDKTKLQQNAIKEMKAKLMLECNEVLNSLGRKLQDLQRKNQNQIDTVNTIVLKIKRLKQDDQALVRETPQVLAALDDTLSADCVGDIKMALFLARMEQEIKDVKLVDGLVSGQYFARIDYQETKWELVKLIPIPSSVNDPLLCGLISDDAMCVVDSKTNDLYVTNMKNGHTEKVLEGSTNIRITSCAPLDTSTIVCGKRRFDGKGGFADGCITLYDRQWRRVKDIVIPEENEYHDELWVDVDNDGMILAAQEGYYNVYVINPVSGKTIDTVQLPDLNVYDGIQAMPRGNFGTCIGYAEFWVFDRSGSEVDRVYDLEWGQSWFTVDKLTETIYITYKDQRQIAEVDQLSGDRYVVDEVSRDGTKHHKKVVEYANPHRAFKVGPSFFSPSGELINCDGSKLLVYKKFRNV